MFNLHESVFGLRKNFEVFSIFSVILSKFQPNIVFSPLYNTLTKIKNQTFLNQPEN